MNVRRWSIKLINKICKIKDNLSIKDTYDIWYKYKIYVVLL